MAELVARQYAEVDYSLKKRANSSGTARALTGAAPGRAHPLSAREPAHHGD